MSFVFAFMNPDHKEASPQAFVKMFLTICFIFWIAASLAASNAGITDALMSFVVFACVSGGIIAVGVHGAKVVADDFEENFINKWKVKYASYATVFKGIFVLTCIPLLFAYWVIAFINQSVRKLGMPLSKQLTDEDRTFALTLVAARQKKLILAWEKTPVILSALHVGIFIQIMSVLVTKFTYLFLAWLRTAIADWSVAAVTAVMAIVGVTLFLLPPVPGVPIYFMSGLMLLAVCEPSMGIV